MPSDNKEIINGKGKKKYFIEIAWALSSDICQVNLLEVV